MSTKLLTIKEVPKSYIKVYQLRHRIFCEKLRWIEPNRLHPGLDIDSHDRYARHFGIFKEEEFVGTFRVITFNHLFTMEEEFRPLFGNIVGKKAIGSIELSKLCWTDAVRQHDIIACLIREFGSWCYDQGVKYIYMVITRKLYAKLVHDPKYGIHFTCIGENTQYDCTACYINIYSLHNRNVYTHSGRLIGI